MKKMSSIKKIAIGIAAFGILWIISLTAIISSITKESIIEVGKDVKHIYKEIEKDK